MSDATQVACPLGWAILQKWRPDVRMGRRTRVDVPKGPLVDTLTRRCWHVQPAPRSFTSRGLEPLVSIRKGIRETYSILTVCVQLFVRHNTRASPTV